MASLHKLLGPLTGLGMRKLLTLAIVGLTVFGLLFFSFKQFNAPSKTILYSNLDKADVTAIGGLLSSVGIAFDVNEAGDAVLVEFGRTAEARMILAERGLPKSDKSGYELFDQMGSLGLTSFMQQVTKIRALEGELVRTIQQLEGVKSARVHLAMRTEGSLRNRDMKPTASVVIRYEGMPPENLAGLIKQLVAAAIPGLQPDQVMISTTDGTVLAGMRGDDEATSLELLDLEKRISLEIKKRVENTLAPFAGTENMRVSVTSSVNLDRRQVTETKFDPDSKVERSTRTVKSLDSSSGGGGATSVSVDQNVPQEVRPEAPKEAAFEKKENKDETVNYEVNSKQVATTSAGYIIERVSVAVVLNKKAFPDNGTPAASRAGEIEAIVRSAAGYVEARGDIVKISMIDFHEDNAPPVAEPGLDFMDYLKGNLGTIINAASLLAAIAMVIMLGLRPAVRLILEQRQSLPNQDRKTEALPSPAAAQGGVPLESMDAVHAADDSAKNKLNKLVTVDVDKAAQVLSKWLDEREKKAA
jgi:flagellar M-ring protein FliF